MLSLPLWTIWLILSGIFLITEIFTVSFFFLWPGIGAFLALIVCLLGFDFNAQVFIFTLSSILLIIFTKPLVKKLFKTNNNVVMNNKSIIGKSGKVLKTINNLTSSGQVKIGGEIWTARSQNNDVIEVGSTVKVDEISGVKLIVEKI